MTRSLFITVMLAAFTFAPCMAGGLDTGVVELSLSGSHTGASLSSDGTSLGSASSSDLSTSVGYSVTPVFQILGGLGVSRSSESFKGYEDESRHAVTLIAGMTLNVPMPSDVVPFVGIRVGMISYGGDGYGSSTGYVVPSISGGIRAFVSRSASVNFSLGFTRVTNLGGWEDLTSTSFGASAGVSIYLRP